MKLLTENEKFFDKDGNEICKLLKNGNVEKDNETLSIHKMAAKVLDKNNYNGWDYFYVKRDNKLVPIDDLRYRAKKIMEGD